MYPQLRATYTRTRPPLMNVTLHDMRERAPLCYLGKDLSDVALTFLLPRLSCRATSRESLPPFLRSGLDEAKRKKDARSLGEGEAGVRNGPSPAEKRDPLLRETRHEDRLSIRCRERKREDNRGFRRRRREIRKAESVKGGREIRFSVGFGWAAKDDARGFSVPRKRIGGVVSRARHRHRKRAREKERKKRPEREKKRRRRGERREARGR